MCLLRCCKVIFLAALFLVINCTPVFSDAPIERVALVIGNATYKTGALRNPVNDAKDMAAKLRGLGFTVVERNNLTIKQIGGTLREFRQKIKPGGVALVFYAGHGLQIKGENYFPAVDAEINYEEDVPSQSVAMRQILDVLSDSKTQLNLVFLDACRDNPFARGYRSSTRGLARESAPSGTLISYATRPGSVAADGAGRNGLYTGALLEQMTYSGQPIEQLLKKVVRAVKAGSKNQQEPWMEGSIEGDFCFGGCRDVDAVSTNKFESAPASTQPQPQTFISSNVISEMNQSLLNKVKESRQITMGVRDSSGALSYTLGDGRYVGYHLDVCRRIVENLEKVIGHRIDIKYQSVTSQNRIPLLENGQIDMECGSTTNNTARQSIVSFLTTVYVEEVRIAVKASSNIYKVSDLKGRNIAVTTGTNSIQLLREHPNFNGSAVNLLFGKDHRDSFLLLETGRADAFVMDSQILAGNIANSVDPSGYRLLPDVLNVEPIGIMIRKSDISFKKFADDTIRQLVRSGEMLSMYEKWFQQPLPPKNIRLFLPPNRSTLAAWESLNDLPVERFSYK